MLAIEQSRFGLSPWDVPTRIPPRRNRRQLPTVDRGGGSDLVGIDQPKQTRRFAPRIEQLTEDRSGHAAFTVSAVLQQTLPCVCVHGGTFPWAKSGRPPPRPPWDAAISLRIFRRRTMQAHSTIQLPRPPCSHIRKRRARGLLAVSAIAGLVDRVTGFRDEQLHRVRRSFQPGADYSFRHFPARLVSSARSV
jgi:hypothetical protein